MRLSSCGMKPLLRQRRTWSIRMNCEGIKGLKIVIYRLAAVVSFLLFLRRTPPIAAQNLMKIRIAAPAPSAVVAPIWIPKESGIYAKYGLDPEVIFFNSGGLSLITLIA